jgi:hypothetical protein
MHLVEQISAAAPFNPLIVGAVAGAVVTVVLHIIRRIRRLIRTATLLTIAGGLSAQRRPGNPSHLAHMRFVRRIPVNVATGRIAH